MHDKNPTSEARGVVLAALAEAVLEHEDAWAARLRFTEQGCVRRLCRAQLVLAAAYQTAAQLYPAESEVRAAMVNASSYIEFAAAASPFVQLVRAELNAARAAEKARVSA